MSDYATYKNYCDVIISRGSNKGKICSTVNPKGCRHRSLDCPTCGAHFTMDPSYRRHVKACKNNTSLSPQQLNLKLLNPPKIELVDRITRLEEELERVKLQPLSVNHHWNIVIGNDVYSSLVGKMGSEEEAVEFLTSLQERGEPLEAFTKLYLEGCDPQQYPVACREGHHFRYIDSDEKIVDDVGGHNLGKLVSQGINQALLQAAGNNNNNVLTTERTIRELADLTYNPDHPFFS
jgi:hypothetical protein